MRILKESNPVETLEYAKAGGIHDEAAFYWWVPYVLRKRERIIAAVKGRIKKATHKYGIEVPVTVEDAKRRDAANGNRLWQKAIDKEMINVAVAFEILKEGRSVPIG